MQGDPIGLIYAYWAIIYFGSFLKFKEVELIFGIRSFQQYVKVTHISFDENGLGYILCDFFRKRDRFYDFFLHFRQK
jgi:hypothetical protein